MEYRMMLGAVYHFRKDDHEVMMIKKNVLEKHQLTQELNNNKKQSNHGNISGGDL